MSAGEVRLRMSAPQLRDTAGRFRQADAGSALDKLVLAWGEKAVAELREATPVEQEPVMKEHPAPGTARADWRFDHVPSQHAVRVTNTQPYVLFLYAGTRAHRIAPRTPGGQLSFFWKKLGEDVVLPSVRHPGTAPVAALVDAVGRLNAAAEVTFQEAGTHIMQQIAGMVP